VSGRFRKTMERSGARSGNGVGSGGYRNRLERRAAFWPLTLRSHALILPFLIPLSSTCDVSRQSYSHLPKIQHGVGTSWICNMVLLKHPWSRDSGPNKHLRRALPVVNLHARFEVSSFNHSWDM